jgi:cyclohexanecarboxylate-CoA ligase
VPPLDLLLPASAGEDARIAEVAGGLLQAGAGPGATVTWQRPNSQDAITLYRACWRIGAVAAPLHHLAGPTDTGRMLQRLNPAVHIGVGDPVPLGPPIARGAIGVDAGDLAVALGTSGSTGTPKVALHTHRGLGYKARLMAEVHGLGPEDCILLPAPLAHISGLLNGVLLAVSGMRTVPIAKWNPAEALDLIESEQVTFMIGPPTFFISLLAAPSFSAKKVRSLRQISSGGAGVTPAFVENASRDLDCLIKRTYGSTEAPTVTTWLPGDPLEYAAATDGRALGAVRLRTVDPANGTVQPPGTPGELQIHGPELFVGYDDPAATEAALTEDGWLRTGDVAILDPDGWLTVVGRIKDVIIRGGENIAAAEIESVLEAHPDILQAVAVGYPDTRLGERVCAFVLTGADFDLPACQVWFEARGITRFKWPERVEVLTEFPLLPAGKPDRAALRTLAAS